MDAILKYKCASLLPVWSNQRPQRMFGMKQRLHDGKGMNMMGWIKRASFCQVYLALAKCHPQSGEGVLQRFLE